MTQAPSLFARLTAGPKNSANRILVHAVAMAALVVLLIASGAGITFALWSSQDVVDGSAFRANLQVSVETNNLDFTFANHRLSNTGSFTVTNSTVTRSETPASYSVEVGIEGDSELAEALEVTAWRVSAATACSASPTDPNFTGTWASFSGGISGDLVAGDSHTYCLSSVASTRESLAALDGSSTIAPTITATMDVGSWSATDSASATLQTEWIYPAHSPAADSWYRITSLDGTTCVDVEAEANIEDKPVIAYGCKSDGNLNNQQWRFEANGEYSRVISRQAPGDTSGAPANRGMAVLGGAVDDDSRVTMTSADDRHALWQLQVVSPGVYQLVAEHSGRCLVPGPVEAGTTRFVQSACNGLPVQQFKLADMGPVEPTVDPTPVSTPVLLNANARYTITHNGVCLAYQWDGGQLVKGHDCGALQRSQWRFLPAQDVNFAVKVAFNEATNPENYWNADSSDSVVVPKTVSTAQLWNISKRVDGRYQVLNAVHQSCLTVSGDRHDNSDAPLMRLTPCDSTDGAQGFEMKMIGSPNPPLKVLDCDAPGGWNATFTWPILSEYEHEVTYSWYFDGKLMPSKMDGWNRAVRFADHSAASYGFGVHTVRVEQSIAGGAPSVVGAGTFVVAESTPILSCGTP